MNTRFLAKCLILVAAVVIFLAEDSEPGLPFKVEVLAYDAASKDFELTTATLTITSESQSVFNTELRAETSSIEIPQESGTYKVEITKSNYLTYEHEFTAEELKQFNTSPLVVTLLLSSINEGMIAFLPFDGDASDSTGNNHNGVVHGATLTLDRKGVNGSSYYFDGVDDYINIPHHSALNPSGDFSISLWALVSDSQVGTEGINDIIRKWIGNAEGYPYSISYLNTYADDANEDKIIYVRYDGQGCSNAPTSYSPTITNDEFIHIVLVKQGTKLRHYLNGVMVQEFTDNTTCTTGNTADVTIGCRGNLVRFFKGKIDDIRFYSRSISEAEVANLKAE